jgi:hypothetical protein
MKTENKKTETAAAPKTIDMTPTWEATLQTCLILVERGNREGRANAIAELKKMAKLADLYVESVKEKETPTQQTEAAPKKTIWIIEGVSAATVGNVLLGEGSTEAEAWEDAHGPQPWTKWKRSCVENQWAKEITQDELEDIRAARANSGHSYH